MSQAQDARQVAAVKISTRVDGRLYCSTGLEYETGELTFLMDATVTASVMWHGFKTYPFTFSVHNYFIKVADTTGYDRSLCNCAQMLQGNRRRTFPEEAGRAMGAAAGDLRIPTAAVKGDGGAALM